ncbi:hypothetical protein PG996_003141 [Apiospora saccharicola]|uniref:F-box domain-containing protein n=1 Tax=Apiospora saccharicola TaxID=335842 RepID=A0ABR1W308_9PEZI
MVHSCMDGGPPADILFLIFDQFDGDVQTLARFGLVSRSWRIFSLPLLLKHVDLSCHNHGRVPGSQVTQGCLPEFFPYLSHGLGRRVVMADFSDEYRPRNLVPRQRALLRLMMNRPDLATHVKALTWTLLWRDFGEQTLLEIDKCTWEVFRRMQNVAYLDLASLHQIGNEPYIRQNPAKLFPAVTDLRLVGWMHRRLVKAIIKSLDPTKLRSVALHYLQDEGAMPSSTTRCPHGRPIYVPMPEDWAVANSHALFYGSRHLGIPQELWGRQDRGKAAILPGHMWFPLRVLRKMPLASLREISITLCPFSTRTDERNDYEVFLNTTDLIRRWVTHADIRRPLPSSVVKDTVEVIVINLGEDPCLHYDQNSREARRQGPALYHTAALQMSRARKAKLYGTRCYRLTRDFFTCLSLVLNEEKFPRLKRVELRGFGILEHAAPDLDRPPVFDETRDSLLACPFVDKDLLKARNLDYRMAFAGYAYSLLDMEPAKVNELKTILRES